MLTKSILMAMGLVIVMFITSCKDKEGGNCSISCGGAGTGQPFVQTNNAFVSESECRQMGMAKGKSCKTSFCPPTGNSSDCYQVFP